MGFSKKGQQETEYVARKDGSDNPVDVCKGWFDPCEYCDKRFGEWISVEEDTYEKIPEKPGFFMAALKNKNVTEVVSLSYNQENIQKTAIPEIDKIKNQVCNKKIKATKSSVLVRWMVPKKVGDRDSVLLCCHWSNNRVLPRYQTSWVGQSLMEESGAVFFSTQIQKWCYKQKNPVWRKEKPPPSRNIVQKCNFQKCDTCESHFTPWKPLAGVIEKDLAPAENGLVMLSVVYGKKREILDFWSPGGDAIVTPIKSTVVSYEKSGGRYLHPRFSNKNATLQVRWTVIKNVDSDDSCFLFAHFHNVEEWPAIEHCRRLNAESALNRNKNFVFNYDKKWYYEIEALKPSKCNKAKNSRRELLDQLYAADNYEMELM